MSILLLFQRYILSFTAKRNPVSDSVHLNCTERELMKIRESCMAMQQTQENEKISLGSFFLNQITSCYIKLHHLFLLESSFIRMGKRLISRHVHLPIIIPMLFSSIYIHQCFRPHKGLTPGSIVTKISAESAPFSIVYPAEFHFPLIYFSWLEMWFFSTTLKT